jgi:hypothetical protein
VFLGGDVSEGTPVTNETETLALIVLRAANRTQAKGTTVRLVIPCAPEVAHEVGVELTEVQLLEVEEYLHLHGYLEPEDMGLTRRTYTITPAGLEWVDMVGVSEPLEAPLEGADPRPAAGDTREDIEMRPQGRVPRRVQRRLDEARKQLGEERPWWSRVFGG